MIDRKIILSHLEEIEDNLNILKEIRSFSLNELRDKKKVWMAEHGLQVTIQNLLDVGTHILSSSGVNKIETYKDVIHELGKNHILPEKFANSLAKMAGFRNILVHEYLSIDVRKIWNVLRNNLKDFDKFCRYIYRYLEKNK